MNRLLTGALVLAVGGLPATAQSIDDLNIQIHGYATQGFLYTTNNNILTTKSSDGSAAWTEAVVNVTAQPKPKLRIGFQARYELLGTLDDVLEMDWAAVDYKANEHIGVRFGEVKTPWGLFNEVQDIDPAYMWSLLPQSVYPLTNRDAYLAHYGGVVYGRFKGGAKLGTLEYDAWGGEGKYDSDAGIFLPQNEAGYVLPNGIQGGLLGGALRWRTPIQGLMIGASDLRDTDWSTPLNGALGAQVGNYTLPAAETGTYSLSANSQPNYFATYEKNKIMVASEYERSWGNILIQFPGEPDSTLRNDDRGWYVMATYKISSKLTAGIYDSQNVDRQADFGPDRYSKDWVLSARYDLSQFLYAKAEQHFLDGTGLNYDDATNPNGLQPRTKLTLLKVGVSF